MMSSTLESRGIGQVRRGAIWLSGGVVKWEEQLSGYAYVSSGCHAVRAKPRELMARLTTCSRKRVGCNNEPTLDRTALEQLKYRTVAGDRHPCPAGQLGLPQQSCSM